MSPGDFESTFNKSGDSETQEEIKVEKVTGESLPRVSKLLASLGHTGRIVLNHTLNIQTLMKTKKSHNVLSKFAIFYWVTFIATLGHMWPAGHGLV